MVSLKQLFKPVKSFDEEKAKKFMVENEEGAYTLLDVRQPKEYEQAHIPGAKFIPLPLLHDKVSELDKEKPVIVYCAIGGRSRVAAQLLSGLGFKEVYNLKGGIKAWQGIKAAGPQELNLDLITGDESPADMVMIAYAMEKASQTFYIKIKENSDDQKLIELLSVLIDVEEKHKKMLQELFLKIESKEKDFKAFEEEILGKKTMEGGFDMEEYMKQNASFLDSVQNLIELAMTLETQSFDLYLRFSEKSKNKETKDVLLKIAEEEKAHLKSLGNLL